MKIFSLLISSLLSIAAFSQTYYNGSTYGDAGIDVQYKGASDSHGNLYTVGLFQSSITLGTSTITSHGGNADGFLTKFDQNGNPIWVKGFGGANDDVAVDVAIDANDNIYLTGYFQGAGSSSFDANPATGDDDGSPFTTNADEHWLSVESFLNSRDCFIIKLDSNGDFIWAKQISNPVGVANEDASSIEVDASGNIYIAGSFQYADFNPSSSTQELITATNSTTEGFLLKLDTNGDFVWVNIFESTGISKVLDMEFAVDGSLYLTGSYAGSIDLDASLNIDSYTSNGGNDLFMIKLDTNGDYIWGNTFGSTSNENVNAIKVLDSGVYVCGSFSNTTDFDPGTGTNSITPSGDSDGFLSKFDTSGNFDYVYPIGGNTTGIGFEEVENIIEFNGNLIVTGGFIGTVDFNNSLDVSSSTSQGSVDAFILELTSSGNYLNHNILGGADEESNTNLILTNTNEILLFGNFRSSAIDLNPFSGEDMYNNGFSFDDFYVSRFSIVPLLNLDSSLENNIDIYPNPVKGNVYIASTNISFDSYKVYNQIGRIVKEGRVINNVINFNSMSNGVYFLKLFKQNTCIVKKIIKE